MQLQTSIPARFVSTPHDETQSKSLNFPFKKSSTRSIRFRKSGVDHFLSSGSLTSLLLSNISPDDFFISAWLDTFPIDEDNPLNELVIPLVLSEETLEIAERLIVHWLVEQRSKEEMERVLEAELALLG